MIIDAETKFSEGQAVTATAASTNILDLGAAGAGTGEPITLLVQVSEAFNNLTTLTVTIETDDNTSFSSPKVAASSPDVALADLVKGYKFPSLPAFPEGLERYVRMKYTVAGTAPTTGKVDAFVAVDRQTAS